jgi:hypothetical protein
LIPYWAPTCLLALPPAARLVRRSRRHPAGGCRRCGYDLRATPERCPECGTTVADFARRAAGDGEEPAQVLGGAALEALGDVVADGKHSPLELVAQVPLAVERRVLHEREDVNAHSSAAFQTGVSSNRS